MMQMCLGEAVPPAPSNSGLCIAGGIQPVTSPVLVEGALQNILKQGEPWLQPISLV